jgi:hypothetical protein
LSSPRFVTLGNDLEKVVTLLIRLEGDQDFFPWGEITIDQRHALKMAGVFDLADEEDE